MEEINKITKYNKVFVKYILIMAISTKGVIVWKLYEKGRIDFLWTIIKNIKNKLILMDNTSSHRNKDIQEYIKRRKIIMCMFLSYYNF